MGLISTLMLDHHHHHHHHHVVEVSVNIREVAAQRPLVGGFSIAQRVQASMSLVVGSKVRAGSKVARSFIPLNQPQKKTRKMQEKWRTSHRNEHLRMLFPPSLSFCGRNVLFHPDFRRRWWCMQDAEELFWRSLAIHVSQLFLRHPRQAHPAASTSCRCWVGTGSQFLFFQTCIMVDVYSRLIPIMLMTFNDFPCPFWPKFFTPCQQKSLKRLCDLVTCFNLEL